MLADEGIYIASESSFTPRAAGARAGSPSGPGESPAAQAAAEHARGHGAAAVVVLGYDVPASRVLGQWFYLYLILDVYSRKIVGFEVHETDQLRSRGGSVAANGFGRGHPRLPERPVLHGDNGATLKATTVLAMMHWLGMNASYSRPRVSDDNAFVESLFRTAKYRPQFPATGFASLAGCATLGERVRRLVQPRASAQRHPLRQPGAAPCGPGSTTSWLVATRCTSDARAANPRRWARHTRNWNPIAAVTLNPERESVVNAALPCEKETASAA